LKSKKKKKQAEKIGLKSQRINQCYAEKAVEPLAPILLKTLTEKNDNIDDDGWDVERSAACCLGFLSECIGDALLPQVLNFVTNHLLKNDWRDVYAATNCIGIIMNGPNPKTLQEVVKKCWQPFIANLENGTQIVRSATAWTIGRIFEFCPGALEKEIVGKVCECFVKNLSQSHAKVAMHICFAISNLARLPEPNLPTTPISDFIMGLLGALVQCTSRKDVDTHNLLPSSFEAINCLVRTSGDDQLPILQTQLLRKMVQELSQIVGVDAHNRGNINKVRELIASVTTLITRIGRLDNEQAKALMSIYFNTLNCNFNTHVHEEALSAIGDLATCIGSRFLLFLPDAINVICIGLNDGQTYPALCKVANWVLSDVAGACKEKLAEHTDTLLQLLLNNLTSEQVIFEIKPHVVTTLGEIAMAIGPLFDKYVEPVVVVLCQAGSVQPPPNPNTDVMENFNTLREKVLEAYSAIFEALKNSNKKIVNFFGLIFDMLTEMNKSFPSPKVHYLCVCVIQDMLSLCNHQAISHISNKQQLVEHVIVKCLSSTNEEHKAEGEHLRARLMRASAQRR